jgi:retron-type reverse transcriptase
MTEQSGAADHAGEGEDPRPPREKRKQTPEEIVRRLQARIVKAQQEGRHNKVKVLQYLLTRSQSARTLAVERVSENEGRKTPGVDGET